MVIRNEITPTNSLITKVFSNDNTLNKSIFIYRITNSWIKYVYALISPNFINAVIHLLRSFHSIISKDKTSKQAAGIKITVFLHHVKPDKFQIFGTKIM